MAARRWKSAAPWLLLMTLAGGCASLTELAPPVDENLVEAGALLGSDRAALERGRLLYVGDCAKCHVPIEVNSLSREQWTEVLPRMVEMTHLDSAAQQDLEAYIQAAGRSARGSGRGSS